MFCLSHTVLKKGTFLAVFKDRKIPHCPRLERPLPCAEVSRRRAEAARGARLRLLLLPLRPPAARPCLLLLPLRPRVVAAPLLLVSLLTPVPFLALPAFDFVTP